MPALLGIPYLGALITAIVVWLVDFFARFVTRKVALVGAAVTGAVVATVAFVAAMDALVASLVGSAPDISLLGLFAPSNAMACITAIAGAHVARWVYDWHIKIIQWTVQSAV